VKFTAVPAQTFVDEATTDTAGTTEDETLIVTAFDVTVEIVLHVADEVTSQVITSLFAMVVDVNVDEFVPTFDPLRFH
jgi:hypothetical protein